MRLTQQMRETWVRGIVASTNPKPTAALMQGEAQATALSHLPEQVRQAWLNKASRPHVMTHKLRVGTCILDVPGRPDPQVDSAVIEALAPLEVMAGEQHDRLRTLRLNLVQLCHQHSCVETLAEALPEYAHLLPNPARRADHTSAVRQLLKVG